jgi:uncharacterized membrane protein HdeD (DUF308 family)
MNKRPISVTVIGWLFIAAGIVGFAYHVTKFKTKPQFSYELVWVCLLRLLAILAGIFLLRGKNWARWVLLVWIAYHVVLSAFHSLSEVAVHSLLIVVVAYFLLRPKAADYFRDTRGDHGQAKS